MFYRFKARQLHIDVAFAKNQSGNNILKLPGLPSLPREDPFTAFCQEQGINVFIPHYFGSWLSDGLFTPENCLTTVKQALEFIRRQGAKELYNNSVMRWRVNDIVLCGSSFGGFMALKYTSISKITKCGLFAPLIDLQSQGTIGGEEKMVHTLKFVRSVYKNAFRGIERRDWDDFFSGKSGESMISSLNLTGKSLFICHGTADPTINIKHTTNFVGSLDKTKVKYFEIKNANHKIWDFLPRKLLGEFKTFLT